MTMNRVKQLDSLWRVWKDNFITSNSSMQREWDFQMPSESIQAKSLEIIVQQLFAEIEFLKKENRVIREEYHQAKTRNKVFKGNMSVGRQQTHLFPHTHAVGSVRQNRDSVSDEDSGRHSTDSVILSSLDASLDDRSIENDEQLTTLNGVTENRDNVIKTVNISDRLSDSFSGSTLDDYSSFREETIEKSNLPCSLTDKLIPSTTKYQEHLRKDQANLQSTNKRTMTLNDFRKYNPDKNRKIEKTDSKLELGDSSTIDGVRRLRSFIKAPLLIENSEGELVA